MANKVKQSHVPDVLYFRKEDLEVEWSNPRIG
jgi:hypothetical protein